MHIYIYIYIYIYYTHIYSRDIDIDVVSYGKHILSYFLILVYKQNRSFRRKYKYINRFRPMFSFHTYLDNLIFYDLFSSLSNTFTFFIKNKIHITKKNRE